MNPLIWLVGGGVSLWALFRKKDTQSIHGVTPTGVPVTVITPVGPISKPQTTGVPAVAPVPPAKPPITATPVAGTGIVYAPAKVVTGPPTLTTAPIVVTPTGGSSVAISAVSDIQRGLNTLGYQPLLKEDGILGPLTVANIKAFQSHVGMAVDGNAGPATKAAISSALASLASSIGSPAAQAVQASTTPVAVPVPTSSGTTTTVDASAALSWTPVQIQHALNVAGANPPLVEDGQIGPKSVAAIKAFQAAHGLAVDGIAGPKTKTALYLATTGAGMSGEEENWGPQYHDRFHRPQYSYFAS